MGMDYFCLNYSLRPCLKYGKAVENHCEAYMFCSHFYSVNTQYGPPSALHHSSALVIDNITRIRSISVCISKTKLDTGLAAHLDCSITRSTAMPNNSITDQTLQCVKWLSAKEFHSFQMCHQGTSRTEFQLF